MKDFYDVWMLSKSHEFNRELLSQAISATFERRGTELPQSLPVAFTADFFRDPSKLQQWNAFIRDLSTKPPSFDAIVLDVAAFMRESVGKAWP